LIKNSQPFRENFQKTGGGIFLTNRRFLYLEITWRADAGSSYNFVTENDINVISAQTGSKNRTKPVVITAS